MRGSMTRACLRTITGLLHVTDTRLTAPHRLVTALSLFSSHTMIKVSDMACELVPPND
jgi:hypothetical protein